MGNSIRNLKIGNPEEFIKLCQENENGINDVVSFVKSYDFDVILFSDKNQDKERIRITNNIQGYVAINDDKREIGVYYGLSYKTQKFIIIYLFSSYVLNGNDEMFADIIYNESIYDRNVYEYTLDLLLPDEHFYRMLDKSAEDIQRLSEIYMVSTVVIDEKMKKLKKEN